MTRTANQDPRVIVALDFPGADAALEFVERVTPDQCRLKVGFELFTRSGPTLVETLVAGGFDVFLDLKYHDIPNTVAAACRVAADLGVWMMNVHTLGGPRMLSAARESLDKSSHRPLLIGVTILTSHTAQELEDIGLHGDPATQVLRLARMGRDAGLDGVVCSAQEAVPLRATIGGDFRLVTPGIRPAGSAADDQHRVMTPLQAVQAGADYLVIGRPITQAANPLEMLAGINRELATR